MLLVGWGSRGWRGGSCPVRRRWRRGRVGGWWWGRLWAGSGPRWRLVFSFAAPSQGLWGWANNTPGSRWRRPWRWWRAISLPWSQVRALIAPSGSARMRRVRAPAPGRALPAPGEGPPGRGSRWRARPGSPIALAPILADDQAAPSQFPGTTRPSIVRTPARSTACPRPGGSQPGGRAFHFCASRRRGQHDPVLLRGPSSDGVWIHVHSRLVADRAPIGCWGTSTWHPTPTTRSGP